MRLPDLHPILPKRRIGQSVDIISAHNIFSQIDTTCPTPRADRGKNSTPPAKEEVLETFLEGPIEFKIGILGGNYQDIRAISTISNGWYTTSDKYVKDESTLSVNITTEVSKNADLISTNVPIIIDNSTENGWSQFFSGGQLIIKIDDDTTIYKDIQLPQSNSKPNNLGVSPKIIGFIIIYK